MHFEGDQDGLTLPIKPFLWPLACPATHHSEVCTGQLLSHGRQIGALDALERERWQALEPTLKLQPFIHVALLTGTWWCTTRQQSR